MTRWIAEHRAQLRASLAEHLPSEGTAWLDGALDAVGSDPAAIRTLFPAAGRRCGRGPLVTDVGEVGWTVDDAVRALLLTALPLRGGELATEVAGLYRYGDAAEKRGVLRGLELLDAAEGVGEAGLPLVRDALRTNDTRLIAAALAPYGADHLDPPEYRQGVLKCVFLGIPLDDIAGVDERADAELARMLTDYAREREAAGRDVPADAWPIMNRFSSRPSQAEPD